METSGENIPPTRFELPPQHPEQEASVERAREQVQEQEKAGENNVGKQQPTLTTPPTDDQDDSAQPTAPPPTPAQTTVATKDLTAQEVDLIEKAWVHQAKSAIHKNKNDPFRQKDEVSRIKSDYVKKRFNKVIPLEDTPGNDHRQTDSGRASDAVAA